MLGVARAGHPPHRSVRGGSYRRGGRARLTHVPVRRAPAHTGRAANHSVQTGSKHTHGHTYRGGSWSPGESVLVLGAGKQQKGADRPRQAIVTEAAAEGAHAVPVRFSGPAAAGGNEARVPATRLVPDYRTAGASASAGAGPLIVATPDTDVLRRLARGVCVGSDRVVEIGASYGECSRVLVDCQPESYLGIDNSGECVRACEAAIQDGCARFRCLDVLSKRDVARQLVEDERPSLMVVDIGGQRALADVMELLECLVDALHSVAPAPDAEAGAGAEASPGTAAGAAKATGRQTLILLKSEMLVAEARKSPAVFNGGAPGPTLAACPQGWW